MNANFVPMTWAPLRLIRAVRQYPMTTVALLTDHPSLVTWGFVPIDSCPINYSKVALGGFAFLFADKMTTRLMVLGDPENQ